MTQRTGKDGSKTTDHLPRSRMDGSGITPQPQLVAVHSSWLSF